MKSLIRTSLAALALVPLLAVAGEASRLDRAAAAAQVLVDEAAASGIRVSVGLADISGTDGSVRIVGSQESYNPASTIKLALMATVLRQMDRGMLDLDAPVSISPYMVVGGSGELQHKDMPHDTTVGEVTRRMVVHSDNTATNVMLYYVGLATVQELLDDLGLETMKFNRQMFPGDRIPQPANVIDAADTIALLQAIHAGDLLSEASRAQAMEWMRGQEVHTKFGAVLDNALIAHKTGETGKVTHDVGYFLIPGHETIVTVFTEVEASDSYAETMRIGNPVIQEIAQAVWAGLLP